MARRLIRLIMFERATGAVLREHNPVLSNDRPYLRFLYFNRDQLYKLWLAMLVLHRRLPQ